MIPRIPTAWGERDATGLTDRAYLDVLGLLVTMAVVMWLLYELVLLTSGVVSGLAAVGLFVLLLTAASWLEELMRQTLIIAGTWRYGVVG